MKRLAQVPDPPVPLVPEPVSRAALPFSSDLLGLRARGDRRAWRDRGAWPRDEADLPLPSLGRGGLSTRCRRRAAHMNQPRILLWVGLLLLVWLNVNAWMKDYAPAARKRRRRSRQPARSGRRARRTACSRTSCRRSRAMRRRPRAGARDAAAPRTDADSSAADRQASASSPTCSTSTSASRAAN